MLSEAARGGGFPELVSETADVMARRARKAAHLAPGSRGEKALDFLHTVGDRAAVRELAPDPAAHPTVREEAGWFAELPAADGARVVEGEYTGCGGDLEGVDRIVMRTVGPERWIVRLWRCRGCGAGVRCDSARPGDVWQVPGESVFATWREIMARCPRPRRATCGCRAHAHLSRM